ncbi:MAG TPA: UDP-2,3-diacylglucosamine diphosphatase [Steroidobacteraceae bacterium]|nr:UDP-2,3-diacylglucosamine diphosphatase [Steroidobacteraceae bacterium]
MPATRTEPLVHLRSVFISDVHLGFRGCAAQPLLEFLSRARIDQLFLLGDIVDLSSMRRSVYWPREHNEVLSTIFRLASGGTRVVYVPGNHDEELRAYVGATFNGVEIVRDMIYTAADGRRLWLVHGDEFDSVVKCSPWLAWFGNLLYEWLLAANPAVNGVRRLLGLKPASLAAFLKSRVRSAMAYIESFEHAVAHEARRRGVDGVVCGHIHRPMMRDVDGILYCNDGDWVESCSMLVEDFRGALRILEWPHGSEPARAAAMDDTRLIDVA